jgi:hypothetical protein
MGDQVKIIEQKLNQTTSDKEKLQILLDVIFTR